MKLLWGERWIEAPRPHRVPGSVLIEVEATVPIAPLGAAHGRQIDGPLRKVASFALTDGPAATLRKARSKRAEVAYSGDYHLVAALGKGAGGERDGARVVALAPRTPRCAAWVLVSELLVRPVPEGFDETALQAFATSIAGELESLAPLIRQSYLYSGMPPPPDLLAALEVGLAAPAVNGHAAALTLRPPGGERGSEVLTTGNGTANPSGAPVAVLGAGDYVRIEVAPALAKAGLERAVLCDREPQIAAVAARELGFETATTDAVAAIDSLERRGLVVVATAHDSHAALAAHALDAGHRVFCEKPAVVDVADLDRICAAAAAAPGELEVGFNRRHNPLVERARRQIERESGPTTIVASIREVDIEPDHWYLWPNQGTRVAGNLCHWMDLALHLIGPGPEPVAVSVSGRVSAAATGIDAERAFTVEFDDGSVAVLLPTGRGDSIRGVQEQIEARRGAMTLRLDDLWKLNVLRHGRPQHRRTLWRDKGHSRMYAAALDRFRRGEPAAYPARDLRRVGEVQIAATELLIGELPRGSIRELLERARARTSSK